MNNFMESLKIMVTGMAGIYVTAFVLAGMMKTLTVLFPGTGGKLESQDANESEESRIDAG